jgi:hypothetical protein
MNERGKGTAGSPRRRPRETTGPIRSQKRIDDDGDRSRIELFKQRMVAAADAPKVGHAQIAERAYLIWQQSGCPPNQDVGSWYEAESQLKPGPSR